ncbi:MAG: TatD family hydrolase [Candidatus Coatesbacteria bacterium]
MALFDTHVHLAVDGLFGDLGGVLARAQAAGVTRMLAASTDLADSRKGLDIAKAHPGQVFAAVGIHPEASADLPVDWEEQFERLIVEGRPNAIGECGLDAFHPVPPIEDQYGVFRFQVRMAVKHRLPLILHSRRAGEQALAVVKEEGAERGVFHCIEGDEIFARGAIAAGFHLGVGGTATFPKNEVLRAMLGRLPKDRLLLETDAPWLAPQPVRGKPNEPAWLVHTAETVAQAVGVTAAELADLTTASARALFRID